MTQHLLLIFVCFKALFKIYRVLIIFLKLHLRSTTTHYGLTSGHNLWVGSSTTWKESHHHRIFALKGPPFSVSIGLKRKKWTLSSQVAPKRWNRKTPSYHDVFEKWIKSRARREFFVYSYNIYRDKSNSSPFLLLSKSLGGISSLVTLGRDGFEVKSVVLPLGCFHKGPFSVAGVVLSRPVNVVLGVVKELHPVSNPSSNSWNCE